MISSYKIYESLHSNDFSERQAKAITECLEVVEKNIINLPNDYATKKDISELKSDIALLGNQIKYLDKSITTLTHYMMGGFAVIFAAIGYLIFK